MQTLFNAWITQNLIWCPYLMVSYLCIFRTLRMVLGPRRERNHSGLLSAPLQEPNTLPDIFCSFHCFQFNQFFSHKLKIICHRIYLLLFNWGMSKQEFQEKLISTTIGVFCDIKEGHLAFNVQWHLLHDWKSENAVFSAISNSQRHRERALLVILPFTSTRLVWVNFSISNHR